MGIFTSRGCSTCLRFVLAHLQTVLQIHIRIQNVHFTPLARNILLYSTYKNDYCNVENSKLVLSTWNSIYTDLQLTLSPYLENLSPNSSLRRRAPYVQYIPSENMYSRTSINLYVTTDGEFTNTRFCLICGYID